MEAIIGITGRAGSGKDSVYQILADELNHPVQRIAFADRLRESAMAALGLFPEQAKQIKEEGEIVLYIDGMEAGSISGREYLQLYGTEAHRDIFGDDFWIKEAMKKNVSGVITVITDVRYANEAETILKNGGVIWEIKRPGDLIDESSHRSEVPISRSYVSRVINNDGQLDDLRYEVVRAWDECFGNGEQLSFDEELRHNFLKRKFIAERSERAKLVDAELSEDPDTPVASGKVYKKGYRLPW